MKSPVAPLRSLPPLALVNLLLVAVATIALCVRLWPDWRHNPDLSHGLFMPVVFLLLLHEGRRGGPARFLPRRRATTAAFGILLTGALLALAASGLYAVAVDWSHALVNFMLAVAFVGLLGAAWVAFAADAVRLQPFNWSTGIAISLWMLTVPIPPGTYTRLTLTLQLWVTESVLRTLHLLGIAAVRHGNIIELARATVGVEEACSGIRSLISCIFAGAFFSATLVRRPGPRAVLIVLAPLLALAMNFFRSLTLTLLANGGVDISGTWHDATGFAVLGVTALNLAGIALALGRDRAGDRTGDQPVVKSIAPLYAAPFTQAALATGLVVATAMVIFFVANTRPSPRRDTPVPNLIALLPPPSPGWLAMTSNDLYQFSDTLRTDHLVERRYAKDTVNGRVEITLYVAYWRPGQAPVSLVASHTPEACWPGSGWTMSDETPRRAQLTSAGRTLPDAEYRLFKEGDFPQYVWFWHLYDGHPISYRDPYSPVELLKIAVRFGFRHDGDQLFVRASSNRPWPEIAHEPILDQFFARTSALGL